ncbi:MAG: DUF2474 domain-containing protein [Xanthobacteraceae bacterium]|jgi:hypothetical protein
MNPSPPKIERATPGWPRRVMWFVAIWTASVGALALVSYGLRLWIGPA